MKTLKAEEIYIVGYETFRRRHFPSFLKMSTARDACIRR